MSTEGKTIIVPEEFAKHLPRFLFPCDYGLEMAVTNCITQTGTIGAYNRLVEWAQELKRRIDAGEAKSASTQYANDPRGGHVPGNSPYRAAPPLGRTEGGDE